jgi:zinc protease
MKINRSTPPVSSGEIKFTPPSFQSYGFNSGLKIFFYEKNHLPIVRINFLVNSGSRFDPANQKGLSNLLAMCVDEGAGKYNALQLADEFEMLGAQFSVSSDPDVTVASLQVLSENFHPALKLFSSVITEPHLKEDDFYRERRKVQARLRQVKAEPDYIADVSFGHFLFGKDSPYAFPVLGMEDSVQNIQPGSVREIYRQKFIPQNSAVVVVGNIEWKTLRNSLNEVFGSWDGKWINEEPALNLNGTRRKTIIINNPGAVQTEIRTGHLTSKRNQEDFFQKQILNLVLGGQFSSRLNLNLREKHGFTYGVYSTFNYFKEAGYFGVSTSVDTENTSNALKEIYSEIQKIKEGVTDKEFKFAVTSLIKRFPSNFETYRQVASNIVSKIIHNLPDDYFETYLQNLSAIKLEDVNKAASLSIYPDGLITVLIGDSNRIIKQINGDEPGETGVADYDDLFSKR